MKAPPRITALCLCLGAFAFVTGCALKSSLPELGQVPAFTLTAQDGAPFSSNVLKNRVWVGNFIFTSCHGPCPRMSSQMRTLQNELDSSVHLVSFTVDPDNDTPSALAAYARQFGADPQRWHMLTGPKDELNKLSYDTFHLSTTGGAITEHSTRFVLVDKRGRLRGYYDSSDPAALAELAQAAKALEREVL